MLDRAYTCAATASNAALTLRHYMQKRIKSLQSPLLWVLMCSRVCCVGPFGRCCIAGQFIYESSNWLSYCSQPKLHKRCIVIIIIIRALLFHVLLHSGNILRSNSYSHTRLLQFFHNICATNVAMERFPALFARFRLTAPILCARKKLRWD